MPKFTVCTAQSNKRCCEEMWLGTNDKDGLCIDNLLCALLCHSGCSHVSQNAVTANANVLTCHIKLHVCISLCIISSIQYMYYNNHLLRLFHRRWSETAQNNSVAATPYPTYIHNTHAMIAETFEVISGAVRTNHLYTCFANRRRLFHFSLMHRILFQI